MNWSKKPYFGEVISPIKISLAKFFLLLLTSSLWSCRLHTGGKAKVNSTPIDTTSTALAPISEKALRMSYIGNMGVLFESDTSTLLIDGLHEFYRSTYAFPDPATVAQLIEGNYPGFSSLEAVLFTHPHRDHFSATYGRDFLLQNPSGILLGPPQVVEQVKAVASAELGGELQAVAYDGRRAHFSKGQISINGTRCEHVNPNRHSAIQNIAYLVDLAGYSILHIGDTNWEQIPPAFKALGLPEKNVDVAVLPYWMLLSDDSARLINQWIAPRQLVATHLPPDYSAADQEALREGFPGLVVLVEIGARFDYYGQ